MSSSSPEFIIEIPAIRDESPIPAAVDPALPVAATEQEAQPMALVLKNEAIPQASADAVMSAYSPFYTRAKALVVKAQALIDTTSGTAGITKADAKLAKVLRIALKDERCGADKIRKGLVDQSNRYTRAVNGVNAIIELTTKTMELKLEEIEHAEEIAEQNRKAALKIARESALSAYGIDTQFIALDMMDDAAFNRLLADAKLTHETKLAAAAKLVEDQRIAAEKAEADRVEAARLAEIARLAKEEANRIERERIEAENARLKAEKEAADVAAEVARKEREAAEAEAARVLAAERAAAKVEADRLAAIAAEEKRIADEAARVARERADAELAAAETKRLADLAKAERLAQVERDRLQAEADKAKEIARIDAAVAAKKAKEAQAEADRIALEERTKREALEKAEADRLATIALAEAETAKAARIAAAAPDAEKLEALALVFEGIALPEMSTPAGQMALDVVKGHIATLVANVRLNAEVVGGDL